MDVRAYLAEHGVEADRILLVTNLRVLGYVFNPVSFFYCYQGCELACIVAEVSNTFGERLPYLLSPENRDTGERRLSYRHNKKLHVSPFFGMTGSRSVRERISSKERLPEPMTIDARNSSVGTPESRRIRPTSCRLARWRERRSPSPSPPR